MVKINFIFFIVLMSTLSMSGCVFWNSEQNKEEEKSSLEMESVKNEQSVETPVEEKKVNPKDDFMVFLMNNENITKEQILISAQYIIYRDDVFRRLLLFPKDQNILNEVAHLMNKTQKIASPEAYGKLAFIVSNDIERFIVAFSDSIQSDPDNFEKNLDKQIILQRLASIKKFLTPYTTDQDDFVWSIQKQGCNIIRARLRQMFQHNLKLDCEGKIKEYDPNNFSDY